MLSILRNRKTIVSILTMVFLIVGVQGMSYAQDNTGLQVSTLSVNPTPVAPRENITLTATVSNASTATAASTNILLEYYQSDAPAQTPSSDQYIGSVFISSLAPGARSEVSISLAAPNPSLTASNPAEQYYYYARLTETDGTVVPGTLSSNARLEVTNLQPNLTVSLTFVSSTSSQLYGYQVAPGEFFSLRATVTNRGGRVSTADLSNQLEISYRSSASLTPINATATIQPPINPVLAANGGYADYILRLQAPLQSINFQQGIYNYYYYSVSVPSVPGGSIRNSSAPVPIIISSVDLAVDTPTISKSTLAPGESFTLTTTVRNQGSGLSGPATLRYYRSTNATIDTTTNPVGTAVIGILSGSGSTSQTVTLTAPTAPATYYYRAHVSLNDSTTTEIDPANNYSTAVSITVTAPPDLVAEIFGFRPDTVAPGERLTLSATVRNEGEGESPRTTLRFYESTDRRFSSEDEVDRVTVAELASNRSTDQSIRLIAPDTPGPYYYRVQVDEVANEKETLNNTSDYIVLFVETPLTLESVQPSKSTLTPGERFTLTATVRNDGSTTSTRTAVEFYSSDDNNITFRDTSIGTDFVSAIAARGTGQASRTLNAPDAVGTYYYGACIGDGTSSCEVVSITVVEETIVADFERPPMYWVDADDGTLQSLTDSEIEPFASGVRNANSIAVDMEGGKVYWTQQTGANAGRVRRADLSGSNVELVRALNNLPQGIAVDASNGKLYVTNARGKVQQMDLDGRNYEPDLIINLDSPSGIAVDAAGGKIYWTEQTGENTGRLQRADLDGSNVESLRELNNTPYGIAVDGLNEKLYVTNSRGKIQRMDLDGRDFEWNFITNLDSPNGIAVDVAAGKIYWTEAGKIRRANLNGRSRQDVVTGIGSLAGIALSVAPVNDEDAPAAPGAIAATADATALQANYPNPFNPETWIPYQLQHAADVTVTIYDLRGTIVRQLLLGHQPAGVYHSRSRAAHWDGRNNLGEPVASGLYFYTLTAGDFTATRKMLIRK